jgi:hypothetical protein
MNNRGLGTVVASILIILISVIAASIFLGFYLKSINKSTSNDYSSCFGIDLKLKNCFIITPQMVNPILPSGVPPLTGPALLMNVERFPGGGNIGDLRFTVTDENGNDHLEIPVEVDIPAFNFEVDRNYSKLVEYGSMNALVRDLGYAPASVAVSAVVGKSEAICAATREPVKCEVLGT